MSLDWAVGAGPDVDAPRFDLPAAVFALVGSVAFVVERCSAAVDAGVANFKGLDNAGAFARDEPVVADVLAAFSLDLSVGLPRFANRLFEDAAGAAGGPELEVAFCAPALKRLDAVVVGVDDSADLEVWEGKLNAGLDALGPAIVEEFANIDEPLVCLGGAVAVDWPPVFENKEGWASFWGVEVGSDFESFCLPRLLNKPALGCASGLFPNKPEFPRGCENMLVLGCEDVVGGFDSVG